MLWTIIWTILTGLVIGLIAKAVLPGKQDIPIWLTILLGIAGSIVGNLLAVAINVDDTGGIDWIRHFLRIAAAAVLIVVVAPMWSKRSIR